MSGANQWTPLGPDCIIDGQMDEGDGRAPVSGRVTSIVLDGGTVYVGTAGGGVWRSNDTGATWSPLGDQQASLSVGAMVLDAAAKRLYIGTGEGNSGGRMQHGQGLLIYNTQTQTFLPRVSAIPTAAPQATLIRTSCMLLEPAAGAAPQRLWMGTNRGLFYSTDQGQTWLVSTLTGAGTQEISSLAQVQDATGTQLLAAWWGGSYYAVAADGTPVLTTANGGVYRKQADLNFTALLTDVEPSNQLTNQAVGRIGLAVAPSNPQRVYVLMASNASDDFHRLYSSSDGGLTWLQSGLPGDAARALKQSSYNLTLAVHPTDPDTLIVGEKALWRSTDAGASWACISAPSGTSPGTHSDQHAVVYDPAHPGRVWLGNDGGLWLSEDGGTTWAHRNRGLNTLQYYALVHHTGADTVLLAGAQDNGTQRFAGHPGWNLVGYGDGFFCGIDGADPRYWYSSYVYRDGAGQLSGIQRSDNAGGIDSWAYVTTGIDPSEYRDHDSEPFYIPFILDPATPTTLYLGTTRLWRSVNRGLSWQAVARLDGTVFSTAWSVAPDKPRAAEGISCINIDPNDPTLIYVGTYRGAVYQVQLKAFDAAQQATDADWSARAMPPVPAPALVQTPNQPELVRMAYVADVAVPKLAAAGTLAQRPLYVAYGSDYLSWNRPQRVHQGRVWKVDFTDPAHPAWTPLGSNQLDGQLPEPPNIPHELNFANALAVDPTNPQRVFVGCHSGVFETTNGGSSWAPYGQGLPNVPVVDLQLHPTRRLLRAATMGRSVWERPIDAIAAPQLTTADVFVRDNIVDLGRYTSHANDPDPLNPPGQVNWEQGVDIKVDARTFTGDFAAPASTLDYTPGGAIDYIGFQALAHDSFVQDRESRVYVQVSNRGPQKATGVTVGLYFAQVSGGNPPPLPANFWTLFPDGSPSGDWSRAGDKVVLGEVPAGSPRVARFVVDAPSSLGDCAVLVVVTSNEDPVNASGTDVATVVQSFKHVALRVVPVEVNTAEVVVALLLLAGVVAGTAVAIAAT